MIPFSSFHLNVKPITELFLAVADGVDIHPCPLKWLPCEELHHE